MTNPAPGDTTSHTVEALLSRDHERLAALYEELLEAADAGIGQPVLGELWDAFEGGLLRHFDAEEAMIFPRLEAHDPAAIEALRHDHTAFRDQLATLGVSVDLHVIRSTQLHDLVDALKAHAGREAATVYQWADKGLELDSRPGFLAKLLAGIHDPRTPHEGA